MERAEQRKAELASELAVHRVALELIRAKISAINLLSFWHKPGGGGEPVRREMTLAEVVEAGRRRHDPVVMLRALRELEGEGLVKVDAGGRWMWNA